MERALEKLRASGGDGGGGGGGTSSAVTAQVTVEEGARELSELLDAAGSGEAQDTGMVQACLQAGALPFLVGALGVHASHGGAGEALLGALRLLTTGNAPASEALVDAHASASATAIATVLAILNTHGASPGIAEKACAVLYNAASSSARGERACLAEGTVPCCLTWLATHAAAGPATVQCFRVLRCLARSPAGKDACMSAGGVSVIMGGLRAGVVDPCVCLEAVGALGNIGCGAAFAAAGGTQLLNAVQAFHKGEDVRRAVQGALDVLVDGDAGAAAAVREIRAIASAMDSAGGASHRGSAYRGGSR